MLSGVLVLALIVVWLGLTLDGLGRQWPEHTPPRPPGSYLDDARQRRPAPPEIGTGAAESVSREAPKVNGHLCGSAAPTEHAVRAAVGTPCGWLPNERPAVKADSFGTFAEPPASYDLFEPTTNDAAVRARAAETWRRVG